MNLIQKVRQLQATIASGGKGVQDAWTLAERLMERLPVDRDEARRIFEHRDGVGLDVMITRLENPAPVAEVVEVPEQEQQRALKAFRKRLKVQRLADESRLGGRYTSGGRRSEIDAIIPPDDFPSEVWKALARAGKLKYTGDGFYAEV